MPPGKYVVAVSGGVDSVVLLDVLAHQDLSLVVAHFDHGIRAESGEDRLFVRQLAEHYELSFEYREGRLGPSASEETARTARYTFLHEVRQKHGARGIVTAHHRDDVLETAILNILRGTGRKGLTALASGEELIRPLLNCSKEDIHTYAAAHNLQWREDSTNQSTVYLRNYIRLELLPRFGEQDKAKLLNLIESSRSINDELDAALATLLPAADVLDRAWFIQLPHQLARETMAAWLRRQNIREFDRKTIERLVVGAKTGRPGSRINIYGPHMLRVNHNNLALDDNER
jgi:tRNA(Ile)-lysidine synthetase-like protein